MRELHDGDTFTDSNYYKIYTPEFMGTEAFLDLVTDDGSVYIKESQETIIPRSYALDVDADSVYADNVVDIYADNLGFAVYCQITVVGEGTAPTFKFNGLSNALLSIPCGVTQTFDKNEIQFSKIEIDNSQDGSQALTVSIFSSIQKSSNT